MKEFDRCFTISFSFMGSDIKETINLKNIEVEGDTWYYYFKINVGGDEYTIEVFGTYDDDNNVRTTSICKVDGVDTMACFGINVSDEDGDIISYIDDIDIIYAD